MPWTMIYLTTCFIMENNPVDEPCSSVTKNKKKTLKYNKFMVAAGKNLLS